MGGIAETVTISAAELVRETGAEGGGAPRPHRRRRSDPSVASENGSACTFRTFTRLSQILGKPRSPKGCTENGHEQEKVPPASVFCASPTAKGIRCGLPIVCPHSKCGRTLICWNRLAIACMWRK